MWSGAQGSGTRLGSETALEVPVPRSSSNHGRDNFRLLPEALLSDDTSAFPLTIPKGFFTLSEPTVIPASGSHTGLGGTCPSTHLP